MEQTITFTHDAQLLTSLLVELKHEQHALIHHDIDTIEGIMNKRLTLLQQLSAAAKTRYDALSMQGYQANEQGMQDWLDQQSNTALQDAWQLFQQSLANAKELNRLNGILINKHTSRNQARLGGLQSDTSQAQVYSKNGQAKPQSNLRGSLAV